jgi:hypothetical protein
VLAYFFVADLFSTAERQLAEYRKQNLEMKARVEDLRDRKNRYDIIKLNIQDPHGALDILEKISAFEFIPGNVTLIGFEYKKEESVKVTGHAKAIADVNKMETALRATNFFEFVQQDQGSNSSIRLPNRPDPVISYSITGVLPKREVKKSAPAGKPAASEEEADDDLK